MVQIWLPRSHRTHEGLAEGAALRGFLYYRQPSCAPPLAGEIRFRVTPSDNPTSFSSGLDFMTDRGVPWSILLSAMAKSERHEPLRRLLTAVDKSVPQRVMDLAVDQDCRQHSMTGNLIGIRCLYAFGQPFDLALDRQHHSFAFIGKNHIAHTALHYVGTFHVDGVRHAPFSGRAICCFEPSPLPEHSGKRVIVMRVLRSLEWDPIRPNASYTGPRYPPELYPREGQLLMTVRCRKVQPWVGDVDGKLRKGMEKTAWPFGILFENAVEYGSPYFP